MTDFFLYLLVTALVLVSLFVVRIVVVAPASHHHHDAYVPSPESRVTPLGYYSAQQRRRVTQGMPGQRLGVPYIEEAETVKVRTNHD